MTSLSSPRTSRLSKTSIHNIDSFLMSFIFQRECGTLGASSHFLRRVTSRPGLYERFALDCVFDKHTGPVNDASFNQTGELLISGSDDCHVNLWNVEQRDLRLSWQTTHTSNIFSVIFLPVTNGGVVASAAADGLVQSHDLFNETTRVLTHHNDRVKVIQVFPDMPQVVLSGSEDKTMKEIDLRVPNAREILKLRNPMHSFDICKTKPWLVAIGGTSDVLRVFDRRKIGGQIDDPKAVWSISLRDLHKRGDSEGITGVKFSSDGSQVLANFMGNYVYLLSLFNEENGIMELPTQKRKRVDCPSTSSSSEFDSFDEEECTQSLTDAVQHLSQGNFEGTKQTASHFFVTFGDYWKMHYILVKCHILEGNLEKALEAVKRGIHQTQNVVLVRLETEIMKLITNTTPSQRSDIFAVDYYQMAEMVNVLGLDYRVLFPDGIYTEDYERIPHPMDIDLEFYGYRIPEDAETLMQIMGSPVGGLINHEDDSSLYDWGWSRNNDTQTETEMIDSHTAMLIGIGKTIAAGDVAGRCSANWEMRYRGHLHSNTIKSVNFLTPEESLVCAGSDDGRLFIWEKETGRTMTTLKGDKYAVNGAISHPYDPMIASWGVDDTVKIWTPSLPHALPKTSSFYTRLGRNEILLENEAVFLNYSD